ncbi:MAG: MAPEG family protein [Betaproteobacteria bacterium]|nr:MAPEG family protein [Betaproteobacteria bacterium]
MKLDLSMAAPMFVLAGWTAFVLLLIPIVRFTAAAQGKVKQEDFRLAETSRVPEWVTRPNRNYMNLLELPMLFYTISLLLVITQQATPAMHGLAWTYVGLRIAHSLFHLIVNQVLVRFAIFAASNLVLLALWIVAGLQLFSS